MQETKQDVIDAAAKFINSLLLLWNKDNEDKITIEEITEALKKPENA